MPHSPTQTLTRKYGDCKDKASLLVALLRVANIPAYVALLHEGSREDVAPNLPGMGMFDHAIVYFPGDPDLWIETTDEYARLGEIPVADQDRLALIARRGSNALLRTPTSSSMGNILIEKTGESIWPKMAQLGLSKPRSLTEAASLRTAVHTPTNKTKLPRTN